VVSAPTLDITLSDTTQLKLTWAALSGTSTGGTTVDYYEIFSKLSSDTDGKYELVDTTATNSYLITFSTATVTFTYTVGSSYSFKLVAHNKYGFSDTTSAV
jgi:hypothetical protein